MRPLFGPPLGCSTACGQHLLQAIHHLPAAWQAGPTRAHIHPRRRSPLLPPWLQSSLVECLLLLLGVHTRVSQCWLGFWGPHHAPARCHSTGRHPCMHG